jgi:hypothetical protein
MLERNYLAIDPFAEHFAAVHGFLAIEKYATGASSSLRTCVVKPFGPHQWVRRSSSVNAFQTRSRGASKTRVMTSSRSADSPVLLLPAAIFLSLLLRFVLLQMTQIILEAIETLVPKPAIVVEPV